MKTTIGLFIVLMLCLSSLHTVESNTREGIKIIATTPYCEGYKDGYKDGYCYDIYGCLKPTPPTCPLPSIGLTTYKHGYQAGYIKGYKDNH